MYPQVKRSHTPQSAPSVFSYRDRSPPDSRRLSRSSDTLSMRSGYFGVPNNHPGMHTPDDPPTMMPQAAYTALPPHQQHFTFSRDDPGSRFDSTPTAPGSSSAASPLASPRTLIDSPTLVAGLRLYEPDIPCYAFASLAERKSPSMYRHSRRELLTTDH